jgi:hypothetical protein
MFTSVVKRTATRLRECLIALPILLLAGPAQAYFAPLQFRPPTPTAGQIAQVLVRVGECDLLQVFSAQDREIAIAGNTVQVTVRGTTAFDQAFCVYPDQTSTLDLVPLPAGSYRVEIYRRELTDPTDVDLMQSANLVVGLAPPTSVAVLNSISISVLGLSIFLVGLLCARRQVY